MTGHDVLGFIGKDDIGERHMAVERVRIEKPEMVIYHGRVYYDVTPYFNMDSSKVVLQRRPENTPERQKELRRREAEKYHLTRTWTAEQKGAKQNETGKRRNQKHNEKTWGSLLPSSKGVGRSCVNLYVLVAR